jgi:hypothetical protein
MKNLIKIKKKNSGHPPYIFHNALTYKSVPLVRSKACHKLAKKLPGLGSLLQL